MWMASLTCLDKAVLGRSLDLGNVVARGIVMLPGLVFDHERFFILGLVSSLMLCPLNEQIEGSFSVVQTFLNG